MEYPRLIHFFMYLPLTAFSLNNDLIISAIDYFTMDNIKSVCLITCGEKNWTQKFVKSCLNFSIKVSSINEFEGTNTSAIHCLQQKYERIGVVMQADCDLFEETMNLASINQYLDFRHKWLIYVENYNFQYADMKLTNNDWKKNDCSKDNYTISYKNELSCILKVLVTLNISVDTDITIFEKKDVSGFQLYDIFNYGKIQGGHLMKKKIEFWRKETAFKIQNIGYKYYNRWDFGGWSMRMQIVVTVPPKEFDIDSIIGRKPSPGVPVITQTSVSILQVVADLHNFSYNLTVAGQWIGNINRNSSTKVVLSGLHYGEQDISPILRFLPAAYAYVDYIHPPLTLLETKFFYRILTKGTGKFENKFLIPFSNGAWLCVIAVISMCGFVLLLTAKFECRPLSLQYSIFSAVAALCQQSFDDNESRVRNHSTARKLAVFITGLSSVLVYNYYTSSVVSWLLNGPPPSINSLKELMDSPLELLLEDIGYARSWVELPGSYYFNKRNAEVEDALRQRKIFSKKEGALLYASTEQGIEIVKAGGYAFHTEVESANSEISKKFTQRELCELGSLQSIEKTFLYAILQKNSPYKEFFVWSLARLTERGIVSCIQRRTRAPNVSCEGSSPRALTLGGAAPAFLLLGAGYLLSVIIMLVERYIYKTKKESRHLKLRSLEKMKYRFQY